MAALAETLGGMEGDWQKSLIDFINGASNVGCVTINQVTGDGSLLQLDVEGEEEFLVTIIASMCLVSLVILNTLSSRT